MKKYTYQTIAAAFTALALVFGLVPQVATAQTADQSSKISISPVTFNLSANPGDVLSQTVKIRNDSASTQVLQMNAENFTAVDEQGSIGLTESETAFSLASWIKFKQSSYTLASGKEAQVSYTITVPRNAEPGGHYASVYGQLTPDASAIGSGSGAILGQKIGALVLLRIAGDVKEDASVETFLVGDHQSGQAVPFSVRVKNSGSVHARPEGFITITDIFGNKVKDIQVEAKNVFPGAIRELNANWDEPNFIGYYTANLLMYYGQSNQQITASASFWIIPWMHLAIWGGVALAIIIVLFIARRRIGKAFKALASGN